VTGAPLAVFGRATGSIDAYAGAVGRWLVTRDGFDFLVFYLPDYDFASHVSGPESAEEALSRSDAAIGALLEAAGGPDEFLDRYAVVLCSDHGQTLVERTARLQERFGDEAIVTASNRAGMIYSDEQDRRKLAARLDDDPATQVALFLEDGDAVARGEGEELRFRPNGDGWQASGDPGLLPQPDALERSWAALQNPHAGDVLVSAAPGYELADLGGRTHLGGGSHGSLEAPDSNVPMLTVGLGAPPRSITGIAPLVLSHFDVEAPPYMRALSSVG
jgi:Type I phosphodiesterase / nucleotide pyrophosphatase